MAHPRGSSLCGPGGPGEVRGQGSTHLPLRAPCPPPREVKEKCFLVLFVFLFYKKAHSANWIGLSSIFIPPLKRPRDGAGGPEVTQPWGRGEAGRGSGPATSSPASQIPEEPPACWASRSVLVRRPRELPR